MTRIYLAGPDVFHPNALARAEAQKLICAGHGLTGISPLDKLPAEPAHWDTLTEAQCIALRNEEHIRGSDAVIANLSPFRGPGADPGTAFEVGFARALGKLVFGYVAAAESYAGRVRAMPGAGSLRDADGLEIEDFGLAENLMLVCGIEASGGTLLAEAADLWDLTLFDRCAALAATTLNRRQRRA